MVTEATQSTRYFALTSPRIARAGAPPGYKVPGGQPAWMRRRSLRWPVAAEVLPLGDGLTGRPPDTGLRADRPDQLLQTIQASGPAANPRVHRQAEAALDRALLMARPIGNPPNCGRRVRRLVICDGRRAAARERSRRTAKCWRSSTRLPLDWTTRRCARHS
jgi:hypothetical protein